MFFNLANNECIRTRHFLSVPFQLKNYIVIALIEKGGMI